MPSYHQTPFFKKYSNAIGPNAVPIPRQVCSIVSAVLGLFGKKKKAKEFNEVSAAPNPMPRHSIRLKNKGKEMAKLCK